MADGGEDCDSDRSGAMKFNGGEFYVCDGSSGWETLAEASGLGTLSINDLTDAYTSSTTNNMFIGHNGGSAGASDLRNIALGAMALDGLNNSGGTDNIAIGHDALGAAGGANWITTWPSAPRP